VSLTTIKLVAKQYWKCGSNGAGLIVTKVNLQSPYASGIIDDGALETPDSPSIQGFECQELDIHLNMMDQNPTKPSYNKIFWGN
jgi:hypothetical protein